MARVGYVQTKTPTWMQVVWDLIVAEVTAHGAYTQVDTVNSPAGMPCLIFQCSGAASPLGRDWYFAMARTTNNPIQVNFAIAEGYDPVTKTLIRPAPGTNNATTIPAADSSYGGGTGYSIWTGTTGSTINVADIAWRSVGWTSGQVQDIWTVVTKKGVWVFGGSPGRSNYYNTGCYVGWLQPLQVNDPGVLVIGDFLNRVPATDASCMVTTRHPTITTAAANMWNWMAPTHGDATWTPNTGIMNAAGDRLFNGRPIGGRRLLRTGLQSSVYGDFRALWPDLLVIATASGGGSSDSVMPGEMTTVYDEQGQPNTYIYAFRYSSGGKEAWINTSAP